MMKSIVPFLLVLFLLVGCKSKKGIVTKRDRSKHRTERVSETKPSKTEEEIIIEEVADDVDMSVKKFRNATEEYIHNYKDIAIREMQIYKIPASITLAQGILESGSGKGRLAKEANNHFGIKCHNWEGKKIYHDDDSSQECFRKYEHAISSYEDHSKFLTSRSRYAKLFDLRQGDFKGWAKELRAAGYATDRKYPDKLISLIERYELYRYDAMVLKGEEIVFSEPIYEKSDIDTEHSQSHKVQRGDTLYSLSKRYNTTVKSIQNLNNLSGTNLEIGQVLKIKAN